MGFSRSLFWRILLKILVSTSAVMAGQQAEYAELEGFPNVNPTIGQIWPHPQTIRSGGNIFLVDPFHFEFKVLFSHYFGIIFMTIFFKTLFECTAIYIVNNMSIVHDLCFFKIFSGKSLTFVLHCFSMVCIIFCSKSMNAMCICLKCLYYKKNEHELFRYLLFYFM